MTKERERAGRSREGWVDEERERKVRISNGEGWDDRRRAHSDGASVEWGLGTKQTSHAHYCSSMVFLEWVILAILGWVCSGVTLWVDAFVIN